MALITEFVPLELSQLRREVAMMKADGWRFIQTHAVNTDNGVDLYYSFMKNGKIMSFRIAGVTKDQPVPSITDLFLAAFVFENEARELFGVDMRDIALDFQGAMYAPAEQEPMRFITPEQKAAREKARKAAAASSEQQEDAKASDAPAPKKTSRKRIFVMTPERQARLDAKWPTLSAEKRAKVEAALKARAEEAANAADDTEITEPEQKQGSDTAEKPAAQIETTATPEAPALKRDTVLEDKIAALDPEKAAKVKAALAGTPAAEAPSDEALTGESAATFDSQVTALLGIMDESKAAVVRAALNAKGGE